MCNTFLGMYGERFGDSACSFKSKPESKLISQSLLNIIEGHILSQPFIAIKHLHTIC